MKGCRHGLLVLLFLLSLASCTTEPKGTAVVTGSLHGSSGILLTLEEVVLAGAPSRDSVKADADGSFRFDLIPKETGFYVMRIPDGRMAVLILSPGDTLNLRGEFSGFPYQILLAGSEDALLLLEFYKKASARKALADSLQALLVEKRDDSLFVRLCIHADSVFDTIWKAQRADGIDFLQQHPGSFGSLIVVDYTFGVRPVLSMEQDLPWYKAVDSLLSVKYPGNTHVQYFHKKIADFERQQKLVKDTGP